MEEWMLNDLLECSVCLERLDLQSRVLPCQHTFCKKCLEEIIATHKELRCPECRVLVQIKLEDLPPNVLLMRILEGMKNVPKTASKPPDDGTAQQPVRDLPSIPPVVAQQPAIQPAEVHKTQETTSKNPVTLHQPCAKALYDYIPQEAGDLSFKKGDIITLKKRVDANWYQGERNACVGFFPASYVQVLIPLPNSTVPQCVALYDFKMSAEDEKDCLTFNKGAVVTVIRRVDENWAEGRLSERIGIFPISFVEMNSAAKHLMKSSMNFHPGPSRSAPALPVVSTNLLNLMTTTLTTATTTSASVTTTTAASPVLASSTSENRIVSREKRFSLNANQQPNSAQFSHRRSADISSRNRVLTTMASADPETQPLIAALSPTSGSTTPSFMTPPALYIALYPYKPQKADELELRKGALYTVSEKCQDGWFKGSSVRTQKTGVFPGNYVQAVRSQPHPQSTPTPTSATAVAPVSSSSLSPSVTAAARTSTGSTGATIHPPPKLPPRALSPAAVTTNPATSGPTGYGKPMAGSTSSSASVPASVVARLATTPAPAPALSPRAQLISPPPNVAILTGAEGGGGSSSSVQQPTKENNSKEKSSGVSLMKRFTSRKKSSPPLLNPYSIDNPSFEDGFLASTAPPKTGNPPPPTANCLSPAPVHVRSGSCPSQLLQMGPVLMTSGGERPPSGESRPSTRHSMGGSQRLRSNKHRPNILPSSSTGNAVFSRSISASGTVSNGTTHESMAASGSGTPRDKRPRNPASPGVTERFRCITPYPPNSEYELELRIGDVVYVHKKREDGWYKGTLHRTGKTGLFPASFVESY